MNDWEWNESDQAQASRLQSRLPGQVFDSHAHVYRLTSLASCPGELLEAGPAVAGAAEWRLHVERQLGRGRLCGGLLMPFPYKGADVIALNRELLEVLEDAPDCRGGMLVAPEMARADAEELLASEKVAGFKPYHLMAKQEPTFQAPIDSYLPLWTWELADERGLLIVLHMVRDRALADPANQDEIRAKCRSYPNARLVLAHAARGFHAPNTIEAIHTLRGLDNVWFDTSGICEAAALSAILREFGPRKLMWGSDFPVSEKRGKCVTVGDNFAWIKPPRVDVYETAPEVHCLPVGLESIRAVLEAAEAFGLNEADLEDIFRDNARRLLGLKQPDTGAGQALYEHAKRRIPAGTHLLSKRPEMMAPNQWPPYVRECRGCEVWDLDGHHYYDFGINSIGTAILGGRDPDVTRAVQRQINLGAMSTLNPPAEVELADRLCEIHPWAECVRLARTGGEMAAVAVRIARATTRRSKIAVCGYHGWSDWYLAANLGETDALDGHLLKGLDPLGVPRELRGTVFTFTFNNRAQLQEIIAGHGTELAAVIMEPCRYEDPEEGFLDFVREAAHEAGALLIFDEITIGWRRIFGGSHLLLGVNPDMALFAKTLGNGHPIAACIGTEAAMAGGRTSFISSSYWTEGVGPAAALATLDKMQKVNIVEHVDRMGTLIRETIQAAAEKHSVSLKLKGYACVPVFAFEHPEMQALKTLYTQLMLEHGILAGTLIYVTYAHNEENIGIFAKALDNVFPQLAEAIAKDDIKSRLKGPVAHTGFQRLL